VFSYLFKKVALVENRSNPVRNVCGFLLESQGSINFKLVDPFFARLAEHLCSSPIPRISAHMIQIFSPKIS
jgi:hypothetical protein